MAVNASSNIGFCIFFIFYFLNLWFWKFSQAGASLEALAKGAVRFSRKFTVGELRERWRSLLYDAEVSAEAAARMVEFELSNPNRSSIISRFGISKGGRGGGGSGSTSVRGGSSSPAKRKVESIRRQYYERRKRLCSFNTYDLSFIDEPIVNHEIEHVNDVGNEPLDENYMVGGHVENYFEFRDKGLSVVDRISADAVGVTPANCSILDTQQKGQNVEQNDAEQALLSVDFGNCSNAEEVGTSHAMPDVPLWKTIEDVSAPEMPVDVSMEVKCRDAEEDESKISSPGYNVEHSLPDTEMNRSIAISGDDFAISDSLLNFTNENEAVVMDVDGENMNDKSCYGSVKSLLLSSPKDAREDNVSNVCQPETLDSKTSNPVSENVCTAEKNEKADASQSCDGNQHSVTCSEINGPSSKSVPNPHSPEIHYEMMECKLNTEDQEIPCNDDVIHPKFMECIHPDPSSTNRKSSRQETINLKREEKLVEPGQRTVSKSSPSIPLVGCGVKEEPSDGDRLASISKKAKDILADPSQCTSAHATPKFAANQVLKQEVVNVRLELLHISGVFIIVSSWWLCSCKYLNCLLYTGNYCSSYN